MKVLIDTNILLRLEDSLSPHHAVAFAAVERLKREGHECSIVPQVLYEFWSVATRPLEYNGLGLDPQKADDAANGWLTFFVCGLMNGAFFRIGDGWFWKNRFAAKSPTTRDSWRQCCDMA